MERVAGVHVVFSDDSILRKSTLLRAIVPRANNTVFLCLPFLLNVLGPVASATRPLATSPSVV